MFNIFKQTEKQLEYQEKFIEKAIKVHNGKYDYSKVVYKKAIKKVCIICPIHGEFLQAPAQHQMGQGCPNCGGGLKLSSEDFIEQSKKVHGNKYDYSRVNYISANEKVCIICPIHGEFEQSAYTHKTGIGCPKCAIEKRSCVDINIKNEIVNKFTLIHGDKYDYSKFIYRGRHIKSIIICPTHGEFEQSPGNHLQGNGCPKCVNKNVTNDDFIEKARKVHGDKYDYSKVEYVNNRSKVAIICPTHGEFEQTPDNHLQGKGCQKCANYGPSKPEIKLFEYIKSIYPGKVIQSDRLTISPKELDIYIPELNIAFEYNGLYFHSEQYKDRNYHVDKTNACEEKGIQLVHIWEDDWLYNQEVVKNMVKAKMHLLKSKHYARKCSVIIPTKEQQKQFLDKHHIQGYGSGSIVYGLQSDLKLVAIMAFKNDKTAYNLNRFASDGCIGAFGKLLKHFRKTHPNKSIISFGSRDVVFRYDNLYVNHGFEEVEIQNPDYMYIENNKRNHKFGYRKNTLVKRFPDELDLYMTEKEMCIKMDIPRIYGCGLIKYRLE